MTPEGRDLGEEAARRLARVRVLDLRPGLTGAELDAVEAIHGFQFADDHRALLEVCLPIAPGFPDWSEPHSTALRDQMNAPIDGALDRVVNDRFWRTGWGARPDDPSKARAVAKQRMSAVPRLAPVYAHRYLPTGRGTYGHPVLSIAGGIDVLEYGSDLVEWVGAEFGHTGQPRRSWVPFWSEFAEPNNVRWYDPADDAVGASD